MTASSRHAARASARRGAFIGGAVAVVLLCLVAVGYAGPLQEPIGGVLLVVGLTLGSTLFPPAQQPSVLIVPNIRPAALFVAYAVFVAAGMAAGWIVVGARRRFSSR